MNAHYLTQRFYAGGPYRECLHCGGDVVERDKQLQEEDLAVDQVRNESWWADILGTNIPQKTRKVLGSDIRHTIIDPECA
jgi:hypothetical protein